MTRSNCDVRFTPESGHGVAGDTDARTACVSWVRAASTLSPTAWAKHPLDNRARRNSCALLYRIQTLLTVLGALFHSQIARKRIWMRVLLIEDDSATAQSVQLMLKSEGFNVYTTDLGEEGIDLGKIYDYDIILLDLNLPDMSGFDVLRKLRISKVRSPILILSGLAGIEDQHQGLGFGADDYMTKPFHKDELVARIHAIVRRSKGHAQSLINTDDLCVNLDSKAVEINGARVYLTGKEYQMLELLALRKGTTLTKEMFHLPSEAVPLPRPAPKFLAAAPALPNWRHLPEPVSAQQSAQDKAKCTKVANSTPGVGSPEIKFYLAFTNCMHSEGYEASSSL